MAAAMYQFDRIIAAKLFNGRCVSASMPMLRCAAGLRFMMVPPQKRFYVDAMRRHQRDDGLIQHGRGFGA